ncbi:MULTISPECIES: hypothetical protein [unclassified Bradyrhizobium]|uniref:hypothetical protein n=1 Tax=unclassified Bradyrhizobium TaxID=2631580 RepID=UPI002915F517|nr:MULTISPECIES: hypothetical protein [unclassified Bradyrhizobium]
MANDSSDYSFGGRISVTVGTDRFPPSDCEVTIEPTNLQTEAMANGDGSPCFTAKPKLYGATLKFRDRSGIAWDSVIRATFDVTISEDDNNRTHIFTSARIVGNPQIDRATGEVSGCEIRSSQYRKIVG